MSPDSKPLLGDSNSVQQQFLSLPVKKLRTLFCCCAAFGLLAVWLSGCGTTEVPATARLISRETASRTIEDGGSGPYQALMASDSSLPTHTIFRPKDLSLFGGKAKLPIIAWGNGACANSPWEHVNFLSEVASHGFLVIAIGPMPAEGQRGGPGGPTKSSLMTDAMNWAIAQNRDKTSQYYGKLNTVKVAVAHGGLESAEEKHSLIKRMEESQKRQPCANRCPKSSVCGKYS
jgi:hypothetical protein